jgi:hypothetical protein
LTCRCWPRRCCNSKDVEATLVSLLLLPLLLQVLAKEVLHSRKAISRLYVNKAQMMSIGNALTEQLGGQSVWPCVTVRY